ncbi:histidine phosphatase family protein [Candidatus Woesearchaeota archaeon]|nr:histidine phosphatase family protein [Candidatus Woesearchaeota archaeon]
MNSTIYFIRHGEHISNVLTPFGQEEMKTTAKEIAKELSPGLSSLEIRHSPQRRARESAEVLVQELSGLVKGLKLREELDLDLESNAISRVVHRLRGDVHILVSHQYELQDYLRSQGISVSFSKTGSYHRHYIK